MRKIFEIAANAIPVLLMVGLIPLTPNDYTLTGAYAAVILASLVIKRERNDIPVFVFGFFIMAIFEYLLVNTEVETFNRNSLFGLMPLWLPFLWGYGFVAIKRAIKVLES